MKVIIEFSKPQNNKFAEIKLCYTSTNGVLQKVSLNIDFKEMYEFAKDTNSISFELFLISSIVYGIDNLITRYEYSFNGWTREIKVSFPVYNVDNWNNVSEILTDTLNFLTGDFWDISFVKLEIPKLYAYNKKFTKTYDKSNYQFISLFSGGLDSLVGAIDFLESLEPKKRILLVSHFDSNAVGPNKDQRTLNSFLETTYNKCSDWFQGRVHLFHRNADGKKIKIETSYRSRSLMFIAIGIYLLSSTNNSELLIPENGTISLNYPLNPSRCSSLSTRTTHPYFFLKVKELLVGLDINCRLLNPYKFYTKGKMISDCRNIANLKEICEASVSCSKSGRKMNWDRKTDTRHCGVCIPCIYRRSGLHSIGFDNQLYGIDILNKDNFEKYIDILALADFLKTSLDKEEIKRNLITSSTLTIGNLNAYCDLIIQSREEVKKWIKEKGNTNIKRLFELND